MFLLRAQNEAFWGTKTRNTHVNLNQLPLAIGTREQLMRRKTLEFVPSITQVILTPVSIFLRLIPCLLEESLGHRRFVPLLVPLCKYYVSTFGHRRPLDMRLMVAPIYLSICSIHKQLGKTE